MERMTTMLQSLPGELGGYLINFGGALLILLIGWLLALLVSKIVVAALRRTTFDNRIASWVRGDTAESPDIEPAIGRLIFWFLMIFVLIAFFQRLQLTLVAEPLQNLVDTILSAAPKVLKAGLLLLIAWVLATGLRMVVRKVLEGLGIDERLGSEMATEREGAMPVSQMLSETVYWLIFLLFLPAILGALELRGLLDPIQGMVEQLIGFLPNLLAAAVIFLVGWFIARIVRRIVSNLLAAIGLDSLGDRVGLERAMGQQRLSGLVGLILYSFILLLVLILALDALKLEKITRPASEMLDSILAALPALFGAGLLLFIAFVAARLVAGLVSNLLRAAGFDRLLARIGLGWDAGGDGERGPSALVGHLTVVAVMLFATVEALELLHFDRLAMLVSAFIVFFGNVLLGLFIFGLGLYLSNLAAQAIRSSGAGQSALLATAARVAIIVLAGAMALRQMDVAEDIINMAFALILGAAAIAAAIAFGIGGRDLAREELHRWRDGMRQ